MDYKIDHGEVTLGLSTLNKDAGAPEFIVSTWNGAGRVSNAGDIAFLYFGDDLGEAVFALEEEVGPLPGLLDHAQRNIHTEGTICWADESLLLDASHIYTVELRPAVEAECVDGDFMTDDFEGAYAEAVNAQFERGGTVRMKTLSGVTLYSREIGYDDELDSHHPEFCSLRDAERTRRQAIEPTQDEELAMFPGA